MQKVSLLPYLAQSNYETHYQHANEVIGSLVAAACRIATTALLVCPDKLVQLNE